MRVRGIGKRLGAVVAAMIAAVALVPMAAGPAQAGANGTTGWTPQLSWMDSQEFVWRNIPTSNRDKKLSDCAIANGIACVAVGQGDGRHSIFHLFRCGDRTLANFIDALVVKNHQTGGVPVRFWGPNTYREIPAHPTTLWGVPNSETYDFDHIRVC
ncbi:hypothetical protein ACFTSF_15105 [Kribbella sp. NPDC056951]|uniref:hypothetical protein n=1 Tax=Kribbella sp. NPDC056951 TaxID=3345978 RepID=UPI00362CF57D